MSADSVPSQVSSHVKAYQAIRLAVLRGELRANQRLVETDMAEWLELSRTPVREALRLLEREGIVRHNPGKGWLVCAITLQDIREIFEVKSVLEAHAAARAAELATPEQLQALRRIVDQLSQAQADGNIELWLQHDRSFHDLLFDCTGNHRIKQTLLSLNDQWYRLRVGILGMTRRMDDSLDEHREIAACVAARDPQRAAQSTREHLAKVLASIEEVFKDLMPFTSAGL